MGASNPIWYLVDSNIFLRSFVRDNESAWKDCIGVLHLIADGNISAYIPTIIAVEVFFVLTSFYKFDRRRVVEAMKSIASLQNFRFFDDLNVSEALGLYESKRIKFTDCLLASSSRVQTGKATILSYDRDFDKLGVRRVEPKQLLSKYEKAKS